MSRSRFSGAHALVAPSLTAALVAGLLTLTSGAAHAQTVYLVGADYYSSGSDGTDLGPASYMNTTNSSQGITTFALSLNGTSYGTNIAIALATGANNFTINTPVGNPEDPGQFAGIGLFFSTSPVSYDPSSNARTPDLNYATSVGAGFGGDFTPTAGVQVANYVFGSTASANGLTSIGEGTMTISVSNFTTNHSATGSFVINERVTGAAAAPEPGAASLLLAAGPIALGAIGTRRRLFHRGASTQA